ncbi:MULTISPECIES: M61 family metallopeptidase [Niastella]|uniref:M61 family metallopeptidase n=1 Tax=Niastella soli TaxID=2821487 RepID=A0ABS3YYZ1_9BACT|nr:PDZ domain-containing protein [Niastella soli]MBO9203138.1 M61 family metallopeptidase [Niastella soli]
MKRTFLILAVLWFSHTYAQKINYAVSFPNIVHHEANISITAAGIPAGKATFRMSRSSPGRYATHEFGKNVYEVKAFDQNGAPIPITRIDGDVYEVPKQNGTLRVDYTVYAASPDGTYSGIDPASIHLNIPSVFMWIKGFDKAPISITFNIPTDKKWTIATQLKPTEDPLTFTAPGLQYFMDCPTKIGNLHWKEWSIKNPDGKNYRFRLALEAETTDTLAGSFATKIKRLVEEEQAVFGEVPAYDFGTYTFIASINRYVDGDGMEHRNSTMISIPTDFTGKNELLGVFAHEFFHNWNVERIRPKTLEPFNFEKSNMSNELWCAEGFTQYYGELLLCRAGLKSIDDLMGSFKALIYTKENTAGAKRFSPIEVSQHAVFVDAGVAIDRTNYPNMYSSYYPYGGAIALALDLTLRTKFQLTLDDYMTALWKRFGKTEIAYTVPALEEVLADVTHDKTFAADFFTRYVNGHESFDYAPLLEKAGLRLNKSNAGKAWLGQVQYEENATRISSNTVTGTPLYNAGLDFNDVIMQIDGKLVARPADINEIIATHKPGDVINVQYKHRNENKMASLTLAENPMIAISALEESDTSFTNDMRSFRKSWLGTKIK